MKNGKGIYIITVVILILVVVGIVFGVNAFTNRALFDTTYSFERGIISLPNGEVIEGRVNSWMDFEDGDQIQVRIDGKTYLTHISNVVLISE